MRAPGTASTRLKQCRGCFAPPRIRDWAVSGPKGQTAGVFHDRLPGCTGGHADRVAEGKTLVVVEPIAAPPMTQWPLGGTQGPPPPRSALGLHAGC